MGKEEDEVQVFGAWMSPFSRRVELGLKLKAIKYEYLEEDLKNKSHLLVKYNPIYKKVPVFIHNNGNPISESIIILQYIDETWNSIYSFFPQDLYQKAQAMFWAKFIDDKVVAAILKAARSKGEEKEKAIEETERTLEALEKEVEGKKFFGGEKIGFVDIVGIVVAYWVPAIEEAFGFELLTNKNKFPNLSKWSEEIVNHSLVKEVLPPKSKLVPYLQVVLTSN